MLQGPNLIYFLACWLPNALRVYALHVMRDIPQEEEKHVQMLHRSLSQCILRLVLRSSSRPIMTLAPATQKGA